MTPSHSFFADPHRRQRGSVLIIVLWICLGLVVLVLYFADSTNSELQAAANRVGEIEARQAVAAGTRYAAYILNNYAVDGVVPDNGIAPDPTADYYAEALQVGDDPGDPQFWFIGRDVNNAPTTDPVFCLVDEASKLNLNTATATMLDALPMANMTSILPPRSWAGAPGSRNQRQRARQRYSTLDPPRLNKGAPFESVDELRLVYGATLDLLFGEDTNLNGTLDPNEDDGDQSPPHDNQDGQLQPGMLEYVTAFSNQPTTTRSGAARLNITNVTAASPNLERLRALLTRKGISAGRAAAIMQQPRHAAARHLHQRGGLHAGERDDGRVNSPSSTPPSWATLVGGAGQCQHRQRDRARLHSRNRTEQRAESRGLSSGQSHGAHVARLDHPRAQSRGHPPRRALHHGPVLSILRGYRRSRAFRPRLSPRKGGF